MNVNGDKIPQLLIKNIEDSISCVKQWSGNHDWVHFQVKHFYHLEALVELLEEYDCGSIGGFGDGEGFRRGDIQRNANRKHLSLVERAEWLLKKYKRTTPRRTKERRREIHHV